MLAFILTMPGNNAWNGKWSGEGNLYAVVRSATKKKIAKLAGTSYGYDFGDGWYARVNVKAVEGAEARQLRKDTRGFCGYEWMIDSIMTYGKIMNDIQKAEYFEKQKAVPV